MLLRVLLLMALLCSMGACGKRPSGVDAPEGTPAGSYPRTYPDLSTDPAPR